MNSFFDDASLGLIKLWPYRASPDNNLLVMPPADYWFLSEEIGGDVVSDMTFRAKDSPYVVDRNIFVRLVPCSVVPLYDLAWYIIT